MTRAFFAFLVLLRKRVGSFPERPRSLPDLVSRSDWNAQHWLLQPCSWSSASYCRERWSWLLVGIAFLCSAWSVIVDRRQFHGHSGHLTMSSWLSTWWPFLWSGQRMRPRRRKTCYLHPGGKRPIEGQFDCMWSGVQYEEFLLKVQRSEIMYLRRAHELIYRSMDNIFASWPWTPPPTSNQMYNQRKTLSCWSKAKIKARVNDSRSCNEACRWSGRNGRDVFLSRILKCAEV